MVALIAPSRRTFCSQAVTCLLFAPSVVRASILMPLRGQVLARHGGFVERLRVHCIDQALRAGWSDELDGPKFGGISEDHARLTVDLARMRGWLRQYAPR
jgi:hypothetical protein